MRRAGLAVIATIAGLVAVLSYHSPSPTKSRSPHPAPSPPPEVREFLGSSEQALSPDRQTDYGTVQVAIRVRAGHIVGVRTPLLPPTGDKAGKGTWATSGLLSRGSAQILSREVLKTQSAKLHTVSGATWTSRAFLTSLQAALVAAGLGAST